ncbi:MAG: J domain-containing protein [Candidatus Riflebacteria bacterium]|nr:J domain-containing protein [Candidatus Riflebacteria bacterium]
MIAKMIPFNRASAQRHGAPDYVLPLTESKKDEIEAVVAIACDVVKVGQATDTAEIRRLEAFVQSFIGDGDDSQPIVFADGMIDFYREHPIEQRWIERAIPGLSPRIRIAIFAFLGGLSIGSSVRQARLEFWRKQMGLGDDVARAIGAPMRDPLTEAYAALGLPPGAPADAVKRAWRDRCKEFHPDLYGHLPPSFQEFAAERFKQTVDAYERIVAAAMSQAA